MEKSLFPLAERMIGEGLAVFPCYKNKRPRTKRGFYDSTTEIDQARAYFLNHKINDEYIGIRTGSASGGIVVIDIDVGKNGDIRTAGEIIEYIQEAYGPLPDTLTVNTPSGGRHLYYHSPQALKTASRFIPGDPIGIDCRAEGGYVIAPDEENYFTDGDFTVKDCTTIPEWIIKLLSKTRELTNSSNIKYTGKIPLIPEMAQEIAAALEHLDYDNRDVWIAQGFALKSLDSDDARRLWDEWSQKSEKYDSIDQDTKWNSFDPKNTTIASLFYDARKSGYEPKTTIEIPKQEPLFNPQFTLLYEEDFISERPPISWVLDGIIPTESVSMITGDAGSGKTWMSIDIAVSIAKGLPWMNREVLQGAVLIIDEESGEHRLSNRIKKVIMGHGGPGTPIYGFSMQCMNATDPTHLAEIEKIIIEKNIKFVVIDALMDVVIGADENSVKEMMPAFKYLRQISSRTGVTFWIIHHTDKSGKGYRGSSAIKGAVDSMIEITKKENSDSIEIKSIKIRDGEPVQFTAKMMFSDFSFNITEDDEEPPKKSISKTEKIILNYLLENGISTKTNIECAGIEEKLSPETIKKGIYKLVKKGYVIRTDGGDKREKASFGIIEKKKIEVKILVENGYILGNLEEMNV
jgi:hypothetical protein